MHAEGDTKIQVLFKRLLETYNGDKTQEASRSSSFCQASGCQDVRLQLFCFPHPETITISCRSILQIFIESPQMQTTEADSHRESDREAGHSKEE